MENMFVGNTDPTPYIAASYTIGLLVIVGFLVWNLLEQSRLIRLQSTLQSESEGGNHG